jgi:hypothetical protein
MGTDEDTINRIIGGNEKETVNSIASRYQQKYDKSLVNVLQSELSGDYRSAVITYLTVNDATEGVEAMKRELSELLAAEKHTPTTPSVAPIDAKPVATITPIVSAPIVTPPAVTLPPRPLGSAPPTFQCKKYTCKSCFDNISNRLDY